MRSELLPASEAGSERGLVPASPSTMTDSFASAPGKLWLLYGEHLVFRLAHRIAGHILRAGAPLALIDGANRFDIQAIVRYARYRLRSFSWVFKPTIEFTVLKAIVFFIAIWSAFLIRTMLLSLLGMITFWTTRVSAIFELYFALELILSGRLVPMTLCLRGCSIFPTICLSSTPFSSRSMRSLEICPRGNFGRELGCSYSGSRSALHSSVWSGASPSSNSPLWAGRS